MSIHPTAIVSPKAQIGDNVTVGAYAIIEDDVSVGAGCSIAPHVVLRNGTRVGRDCQFHVGAAIGGEPQDLSFGGEASYVEIGDRNVFREYVTIHRGTGAETKTVIGNDCFLMAVCHVGHNCHIGNHVIISNNTLLAGHVSIADRAIVSGACAIHQFVRIGTLAFMAGGVRINKDLPPFMLAMNDNTVGGLNRVGLKRAGFSAETLAAIKSAYSKLYRSGLNMSQALEQIEQEPGLVPEVRLLVDFIRASERGVCSNRSNHARSGDPA